MAANSGAARAVAIESEMEALRMKYASLADDRDRRIFPLAPKPFPTSVPPPEASAPQKGAHLGPPRSKICTTCGGSGVEREMYNHQVRERTCRGCEGEGVQMMEPKKDEKSGADESTIEKNIEKKAGAEDDLPPHV
jgi:hypothetical protein